jgi:hypothetical protein
MRTILLAGFAGLAALAACSDGGPAATGRVDVSFATTGSAAAAGFPAETYEDESGNVLVIDSAAVVLRKLHLQRASADSSACESVVDPEECSVLKAGPFLVMLPLAGGVDHHFTVPVEAGTYTRAMLQLHKPTGSADVDFLQDHPEFAGVSVRVIGTFNGTPFIYVTSVTDVQHTTIDPPLSVIEGETAGLTVRIDLSTWFRTGGGDLVDPATAIGAGANVTLVHQNVIRSFHGFQDADHDGHPDA